MNGNDIVARWSLMGVSELIRQLFSEYEKAFSALDFRKSAEFFAGTFISAGPKGTITNSKAEFVKASGKAAAFYKSVGQTSAKILMLDEEPITEQYSIVNVHWGVTFQKTGDKLVEFDVSYFVQKTGKEPKIILLIAHQDEQKAMQELGLLKR
jgi:hypothetical protein